jgi:hypothetical protein
MKAATYNPKKALESKLGKLTEEQYQFAVEQFERNSAQMHQADRKMSTAEALNELSLNVHFYNRHSIK